MRMFARFFGFVFATGALLFVIAALGVGGLIYVYSKDLPDYSQLKNYEPPVMTRVHAGDGSLLAEYSHERRLYLPIQRHSAAGEAGFHLGRGQEFLQP